MSQPVLVDEENDDYSFESEVTGQNEFRFEMEGMKAKLEYLGEDSETPFRLTVEEEAGHVDITRNDGKSIALVGDVHALSARALGETFNAHIYNMHDWDELTQDNMAVGMAYDTWMDGSEPRSVKLTGRETW
jgi:hypothetical protein